MEEKEMQLDERDIYCITRVLQSSIFENCLFFGCTYCRYQEDCKRRVDNKEAIYFDDVRERLGEITGLYTGGMYNPDNPEILFNYHGTTSGSR